MWWWSPGITESKEKKVSVKFAFKPVIRIQISFSIAFYAPISCYCSLNRLVWLPSATATWCDCRRFNWINPILIWIWVWVGPLYCLHLFSAMIDYFVDHLNEMSIRIYLFGHLSSDDLKPQNSLAYALNVTPRRLKCWKIGCSLKAIFIVFELNFDSISLRLRYLWCMYSWTSLLFTFFFF